MIRKSKSRSIGALAAVLVTLAGCAGKIRYPNFYTLSVPTPPARDQSKPVLGSVAVREFDAPRFLRGGPIAYRESPDQLGFYEYDRWAEDPRHAVTGAVIQQMQSRGVFQSVYRFDGRGSPDCLLTGSIDHLEEVDQGSVVTIEVGLSGRLINLRTGEVLWQGYSAKSTKLEQHSVRGIVSDMSHELGSAVEDLVSSLQDRLLEPSLSTARSTEP